MNIDYLYRFRKLSASRLGLCVLIAGVVTGCTDGSSGGQIAVNQSDGLLIDRPGFLTSRAINESNVEARLRVEVLAGPDPEVVLNSVPGSTQVVGEVFVQPGSDATLTLEWFETGVDGLPDTMQGDLLLASWSQVIPSISSDMTLDIDDSDYDVMSTDPLDIDGDELGNLQERLDGSNPNDAADPNPGEEIAQVLILFNEDAPIIDGGFDSTWNLAQFLDRDRERLAVDNILIGDGSDQASTEQPYRWAGMHDGEHLYLLIFGESGNDQTPFSDSVFIYDDDAIDIYWDGNNSKGSGYDGFDDHQVIIALLADEEGDVANSSNLETSRFEFGDRSRRIPDTAIEFGICLCAGTDDQQIYEVKINLAAARIPIGETIGFEIQINNDTDGDERDQKWAWANDTGQDDTWRFPLRMGTARLEPLPQ